MIDHGECPLGSHNTEVGEDVVTLTCAVDGSERVVPRCPTTTKVGARCRSGMLAEGQETCRVHARPPKPERHCRDCGVVVHLVREYWVHKADHSPQPDERSRCFVCGLGIKPYMGRVAHAFGHPGAPTG